jgi:hypothetical protein
MEGNSIFSSMICGVQIAPRATDSRTLEMEETWKNWNAFLDQVFSDVLENNMTAGLEISIWNEPDLDLFWDAPQT